MLSAAAMTRRSPWYHSDATWLAQPIATLAYTGTTASHARLATAPHRRHTLLPAGSHPSPLRRAQASRAPTSLVVARSHHLLLRHMLASTYTRRLLRPGWPPDEHPQAAPAPRTLARRWTRQATRQRPRPRWRVSVAPLIAMLAAVPSAPRSSPSACCARPASMLCPGEVAMVKLGPSGHLRWRPYAPLTSRP
jgi:hypothetical protein